jgi:cob(I)alamin adenosyltransferase
MVNLTRIYTRTGDAGTTRLSDFSETPKTDPRVQAYGHVDEANSIIGLALTQPDLPADIAAVLRHIQNELFDCGADLSNPLKDEDADQSLRIIQPYVDRLERWCDEYSEPLAPLQSFILPGGSPASAWLQLARTVVRRAERTAWAAASVFGNKPASEGRPGGVNLLALAYLNRLSDLLFILARAAGQGAAEVLWVPGKDRLAPDAKAARLRAKVTGTEQPADIAEEGAQQPLDAGEAPGPAHTETEQAIAVPGAAEESPEDSAEPEPDPTPGIAQPLDASAGEPEVAERD